MTFMGVVFTGAIIVFVAMIVMKLFPSYVEYNSIKQVIKKIGSEPDFANMTKQDIISTFDKGASTGYISVIKGSDLTITKDETGKPVVTAEYQVVTPLVGNVSALLDFKTSTETSAHHNTSKNE